MGSGERSGRLHAERFIPFSRISFLRSRVNIKLRPIHPVIQSKARLKGKLWRNIVSQTEVPEHIIGSSTLGIDISNLYYVIRQVTWEPIIGGIKASILVIN